MEHAELTGAIIGAGIEVHRGLGPGFIESVYEHALAIELAERGLPFDRQREVPIFYKGVEIARHRLDLVVANTVVVELKAVRQVSDAHFAVVRSYLHASECARGLILNFAGTTLEARRVSRAWTGSRDPRHASPSGLPGF